MEIISPDYIMHLINEDVQTRDSILLTCAAGYTTAGLEILYCSHSQQTILLTQSADTTSAVSISAARNY